MREQIDKDFVGDENGLYFPIPLKPEDALQPNLLFLSPITISDRSSDLSGAISSSARKRDGLQKLLSPKNAIKTMEAQQKLSNKFNKVP